MNATETETTLNSNLFLGGRIREFHAGKSGFKGCLYQLIIGWDFVKKISQFSHIFSHERNWHSNKAEQFCKTSTVEWLNLQLIEKRKYLAPGNLAKLVFWSIDNWSFAKLLSFFVCVSLPFNLYLDFWKSRSLEIKVCFKP